MLYFPTQHDISTFTSSSAGNEIGTPLLGFGHQKQHRGMITSQKGLTSLYQLRCIQKSPHEYARKRQFIRTTSLKSLKRLQATCTLDDCYHLQPFFFPISATDAAPIPTQTARQQTHETCPA